LDGQRQLLALAVLERSFDGYKLRNHMELETVGQLPSPTGKRQTQAVDGVTNAGTFPMMRLRT
jgi:hypothetical protein